MGRKHLNRSRFVVVVLHKRMNRLVVAITPGMIVGPRDAWRLCVVDSAATGISLWVLRMKMMGCTDASQRAERDSEILMVARSEHSSASLPESLNRPTVRL